MELHDIRLMAWAPFAKGQCGIFQAPTLAAIGKPYGKTPAQVILRWLLQENIIAIPKSVHEKRIRQNFSIDDFELTADNIATIHHMDRYNPLILDIASIDEVHRLYGITFKQ